MNLVQSTACFCFVIIVTPLILFVSDLGIAIGGSCVVCPVYISEYAEASIRGTLGTCFQLFLTIGILIVFSVGPFTTWITLSWLCLAAPILNLIGLFYLPESPIWLLKNVSLFTNKIRLW